MKLKNAWALILTVLIAAAGPAFAEVFLRSYGLDGCMGAALNATSDGAFQFAGCSQTSKGFYYSTDFGTHWTPVKGGDYRGNRVEQIEIENGAVFIRSSQAVYRADLPTGSAWTPRFREVGSAFPGTGFKVVDGYAYGIFMELDGTRVIRVTSATTGAEVHKAPVPAPGPYFSMAKQGSALLLVVRADPTSGGRLYKYALGSDGRLSAPLEVATLPAGSLPYDIDEGPGGALYLTALTAELQLIMYSSSDEGASFSPLGVTTGSGVCFAGSTIIFGNYASRDGGATWNTWGAARTSDGNIQAFPACIVDPANPSRVLALSRRGFVRTSDFASSDPLWEEVNSGVEGANIWQIAQHPARKNILLTSGWSGTAVSFNFGAASTTWRWSCPSGENLSGCYMLLASEPSDPNIFYGVDQTGGKVFRGAVTGGASLAWSELVSVSDSASALMMALRTSSHLPGTVLLASANSGGTPTDGRLRMYSASDGALARETLVGRPVTDVVVVSSSVLYASVGFAGDPAADWGVWRSTDGGANWSQITSAAFPAGMEIDGMAYSAAGDTLWALAKRTQGGHNSLYYLARASSGGSVWRVARTPEGHVSGSSSRTFTAITVDSASGRVYLAGDGDIFSSIDRGVTWLQLLEDEWDNQIEVLFFDDLIEGSDLGLRGISAPRCSMKLVSQGGTRATFRVSYNGRIRRATLEAKGKGEKIWRSAGSFKIKRGRTVVEGSVGPGKQIRARMKDCATRAINIR